MNAYQKKPLSDEAHQALADMIEHQIALTRLDNERKRQLALRAGAVNTALAAGASLRDIAERLNVSPESIRSWATTASLGPEYRRDPRVTTDVVGVQVAEGIMGLQPAVVLYLRPSIEDEQIGVMMHPDLADALAPELQRWASRAREKDRQRLSNI